MKVLKGTEAIGKAIESIRARGKKLDMDIQIAGVSCLAHIEEHGDVTLVNRLIEAMPKGSRVNALREWVDAHGQVKYNEETQEFDYSKKKSFLQEEAIATMWTEFAPESKYRAINLTTEMHKLLKKAHNRADSKKGDVIPAEELKAASKLFGYVHEE